MISNVIIFGTGVFFMRRKQMLPDETNVVAFLDNNIELQGKYLDGVLIYSPLAVTELDYDTIILASVSSIAMKNQLVSLGVLESKIMFWEEYVSAKSHGILNKYQVEKNIIKKNQRKVLVVVPIINYAGGFLSALYASIALKNKDYYVVITASAANNQTIEEVNEYGIDVWICPSLPYIENIELEWIQQFDFAIVNSLQNIICVSKICEKIPVIWWLHEHKAQYNNIVKQYNEKVNMISLKKANIYAVSNLAKSHFNEFYPDEKVGRLVFGLPDFYKYQRHSERNKIVIALIGTIVYHKNQIGFINAVKKLSNYEKSQIECWIIGRDGGREYRENVESLAKELEEIKICGELSRKEIEQAFLKIDVVVCPSTEETMSLAIVEGMMNKKICITNNNTGIAEFIQDGENGFVYEAGNESELLKKIKYVIHNINNLNYIRKKARETYETVFSMNVFSDNLQTIAEKLIEN